MRNDLSAGTSFARTPEEKAISRTLWLMTDKPTIFACNVRETDLAKADTNPWVQKVRDYVGTHLACEAVVISAQIESELIDLSPDEAEAMQITVHWDPQVQPVPEKSPQGAPAKP